MAMLRYDYDSVLDRLKNRVLKKLNGKDLLMFSTNAAILEAAAEEFSDFAMYDEYLTRENIWETARGHSSIMKQIGFFGYRPHRKIGAVGRIRMSPSKNFDSGHFKLINIPKWTKVSGGGLDFVVTSEYGHIPRNTVSAQLPVVQGDVVEFKEIVTHARFPKPKGVNYAQIIINDPDIENNFYEVKVNGVVWEEIPNLRNTVRYSEPGKAEVYSIRTLPNYKGIVIYFGNNEFGKSLNYDDTVDFKYLRTLGAKGNVLASGVINSVDSSIVDDSGNIIDMYCRNDDPLIGGQDYESLLDIKAFAPQSFQTSDKAITSKDYIRLIKQTNELKVVQVWGEKEINEDKGNPPGTFLEFYENVIYITGYSIDELSKTGIPITETNKANIRTFLNDRKGTTDILQFMDTEILYVTFKPIVYINDLKFSEEQVAKSVHDALADTFSIYNSVYNKSLYSSEYITVAQKARGVSHCTCSLVISRFVAFDYAYGFDINLNILNIKKRSIEIKVKYESESEWILVGVDSPLIENYGDLVGVTSTSDTGITKDYLISGASIDYSNGTIGNITIQGLEGDYSKYQVCINFQIDDIEKGDLKLTTRCQVFCWYNNIIEVRSFSDY